MASRKSLKKRKPGHQLPRAADGPGELAQRLAQGAFKNKKLVIEPPGEVRMSDVLDDFIAPYAGAADTEADYRKLLTLGIIAWDLALTPKARRPAMLDELLLDRLGNIPESLKSELRDLIRVLIARKEAHFADNRRMVIDFTLVRDGDGYQLTVASSLEPSMVG